MSAEAGRSQGSELAEKLAAIAKAANLSPEEARARYEPL